MAKKKTADEPSLRDRLSEAFLSAFQKDFEVHGVSVIERMREKDPSKYAELGARLIAAVEQSASLQDYSRCETQEDIARQLLKQVGLDDRAATPAMLEAASTANDDFIAKLQTIAAGN